jgi:putative glycosyltransferase (TIGR04372 family)
MKRWLIFSRQIREVQAGGWPILRKKLNRSVFLVGLVAGTVITFPLMLIVRLLRARYCIRFGYFTANRIGHFSFDLEYYLTEKFQDPLSPRRLDLFFFEGIPANTQLARMCRRAVVVNPCVRWLYWANKLLPGGVEHRIFPARHRTNSRDKVGLMDQISPRLLFTNEENSRGKNYLMKLGLSNDTKFVCLAVRDSAYLEQTQGGRDWSYHNFRDTCIEDYEEAALALAEKGYWVLRMGKAVQKKFLVNHPQTIDYATSSDRCDFLDLWLMANCHFAISTGLGLDSVAEVFRRPIVLVNYLPLMDMVAWGHYITVPKVLTWAASGRPLTLSEQVRHTSVNGYYYRDNGIEISDLGATDVTNAILEMEARLAGDWLGSSEDDELNRRFWNAFRSYPEFSRYHGWIHPHARVGTHYLRSAKDWLFD